MISPRRASLLAGLATAAALTLPSCAGGTAVVEHAPAASTPGAQPLPSGVDHVELWTGHGRECLVFVRETGEGSSIAVDCALIGGTR